MAGRRQTTRPMGMAGLGALQCMPAYKPWAIGFHAATLAAVHASVNGASERSKGLMGERTG